MCTLCYAMNLRPKHKILVVVHDAGGADIIGAYVKKNRLQCCFVCYVAGPAVRVFRRRKISATAITYNRVAMKRIVREHRDAQMVLTGTGWMTEMELQCIREAKLQGMKVASYIDTWSDYRERFGYPRRHWEKNLPDEIWAGDASACGIARRVFSRHGVRIRLVPNEVFKEARMMYGRAARHIVKKPAYILFVSEPFGASARFMGETKKRVAMECATLKLLLDYFARAARSEKILIRLHPAESAHKYDALIGVFSDRLDISMSRESDMYKDLARASTVIGMTSMFLVIAALCKKRVVSFFLGDRSRVLSFPGVVNIKKPEVLEKILR